MPDSPATAGTAASFSLDTVVEPLAEGRYSALIKPEWSGPPGPNGGYIAALILRAIRAEVGDPDRPPRSITVHYLRPPANGAVELEITVERAGRSATTCSARMLQEGRTMALALSVLCGSYESAADWATPPPQVPRPQEIVALETSDMAPEIFNQHEFRTVFGGAPFSGAPEALAGGWVRTRTPAALEPELLALYTDVWWPAPFPRLQSLALAPTLDLTIHFRAEPPVGPHEQVLGRFSSSTSAEGFFEEDATLWSEDGVLLAQSRQLALMRPLPEGFAPWESPGGAPPAASSDGQA